MFFPVTAAVAVIEQKGLQIVHGMGELCLRCLIFLKLFKQSTQLDLLIFRQNAIDSFSCLFFPLMLGLFALIIIGICITGINFHDIMQ